MLQKRGETFRRILLYSSSADIDFPEAGLEVAAAALGAIVGPSGAPLGAEAAVAARETRATNFC